MGENEVRDLFHVLDLTGVFANAMLGGVIGRREKLDLIGFAVLAVLSGLGGGMIRDVLLQAGPPVALTDLAYLTTALVAAGITYLLHIEGRIWHNVWPVIDALALGCWAAAGAARTLGVGLGWLPAILLGTITAVGGGMVRDIVLRRVPTVLGGNTLYATCAILASTTMVVLAELGQPTIGMVAALVVGAGLCLVARWRGWILPAADAWSPTRVVPVRWRHLLRRRPSATGSDDTPDDPTQGDQR